MDQTAQLIGAVGALWAALTALGGGVIRWLAKEVERCSASYEKKLETERSECRAEHARLNAKLDGAGDLVLRQNESMQKQIDSLNLLVTALQGALDKEVK